MALKITNVENGNTPKTEKVRITATKDVNTKGYALVDKTFDQNGKLSNEFRHIYIFPALDIKKGEEIILCTAEGTDEKRKYGNSDSLYQALYWGSDHCIWNADGDQATLIEYAVVNSFKVIPKKK
ncbi:hypothetical protein GM921_00625 [Pedobacter sp. LMG 31464]|uniref:Uncharacterized protein n=1 Tax=Pedobacter planticolens TaxID=2679964 RepID=A0A923DUA1_9SPHI|nr:hypothetical protein [Pedobacter planticolens]MBB2143974.1 hypothetical protein [Pedobacter planticolens]